MANASFDRAVALDSSNTFKAPSGFTMPERSSADRRPLILYGAGHSLGLRTLRGKERVDEVDRLWERLGVEGHFEEGSGWYLYDELARPGMSRLLGAKPDECVLTGTLTGNIHTLLNTFFGPKAERPCILTEARPALFPSDRYAVASHVRLRGLNPADTLLEITRRPGERHFRHEDIEAALEKDGHRIAVVFLSAVQFVTGQALDVKRITELAQSKGCIVGFDLAHAYANIELQLHDWNVDFAAFCGYKYGCAGPGNGAGIFLHERHCQNPQLVHPAGWWGNDPKTRFQMSDEFVPAARASRLAHSNATSHSMAAAVGALETLEVTAEENGGSHDAMWHRREALWRYLCDTVLELHSDMPSVFEIVTPIEAGQHGAMLTIAIPGKANEVALALRDKGFCVDPRGSDYIRISTSPLWVTARQIHPFGQALREVLADTAV